MYRRFHDRFGTAGVVIGVIALVAALGGTAFAAGGGLNGKQKKEVKAIAKSFAGKPGAPGAAGANGTNGKDGAAGAAGQDGADGVSVKSSVEPKGVKCKEGGSKFTSASPEPAYACNGEKGKEGNPWAAGGTLPSEATETGAWSADDSAEFSTTGFVALSFSIPLAAPLAGSHARYVGQSGHEYNQLGEELTTAEEEANPNSAFFQCEGSAAAPEANSGYLCVYAALEENAVGGIEGLVFRNPASSTTENGASTSGTLMQIVATGANPKAYGTWAVTG